MGPRRRSQAILINCLRQFYLILLLVVEVTVKVVKNVFTFMSDQPSRVRSLTKLVVAEYAPAPICFAASPERSSRPGATEKQRGGGGGPSG